MTSDGVFNIIVSSLITSGIMTAVIPMLFKRSHLRFECLHVKRIEIIADIYSQLRQLEALAVEIADTSNPLNEPTKSDIQEAFSKFCVEYKKVETYFEQHRILVPKKTADVIEKLLVYLSKAASTYRHKVDNLPDGAIGIRIWVEFKDVISNKIPPVRKSLEEEIRKIFG
jgi:hypothetical protein